MADEVITFSLEGNLFVINHFKGVMEMPIVSSGHFPEAKTMNDGVSVVLDPSLMKKWLVTANDFVGSLSDIRIWDTVKSASDIKNNRFVYPAGNNSLTSNSYQQVDPFSLNNFAI